LIILLYQEIYLAITHSRMKVSYKNNNKPAALSARRAQTKQLKTNIKFKQYEPTTN